ncbi:2-dehydropantoate 2-reductase [Vibrio sp. DNF-1]|nr:2-dehydropantoate 2-reductase [Vibrio salinus]
MNIVILGPGAIGKLWAYHLNKAGHRVSLWSRKTERVLSVAVEHKTESLLVQNNNEHRLKEADIILITVKARQVENAIHPLLPYLSQETILLFMHNGMGTTDLLTATLAKYPTLLATTSHGAMLTASGSVAHTGRGNTIIGGLNEKGKQCRFIADVFHHALPNTEWTQDIYQALWHKLSVNCAINPLTAILQCKNGDLAKAQNQAMLSTIIDEISRVMQSEGIDIQKNRLRSQINTVIQATAENLSSMNRDIALGRVTEIEFITGYLLKRARYHNVAVPENEKLYNQVKELERNGITK